MLRIALVLLTLAYLCNADMRIVKLIDRANGTVYTKGEVAKILSGMGHGRGSNLPWGRMYIIGSLTKIRTVSGKLEMGLPSNGCGLTNFQAGGFDPDNTILMLQFWKDDYRDPEYYDNKCSMPTASLELQKMGWKNLMFSCPGHDCSIVFNLDYSMISYDRQLQGMQIFLFYERIFNVTKEIYENYEIYVTLKADSEGLMTSEPIYLAIYILATLGCLIVLGYLIFKFVVYMRSAKKTLHMTITYICNLVAICCFIAFFVLLWCWLYTRSVFYIIFGLLAIGFSFLGSANFSLAMWWSGFLFPQHQRGFHSRILVGVVIPFFVAIGFGKLAVERTQRESIMNTILTGPGLLLLFVVSIHMVVIGLIMTRKFFYSKANTTNLHIKSLKKSDAKKIIILLTTTGAVVIALLYMSVIFHFTVNVDTNIVNWQYQWIIPALLGAVNIFLVTYLHNIDDPKRGNTINSSSMMGYSSGSAMESTSSTTR